MDRTRLEEIVQHHGIVLLLQFGSSVSGLLHQGSDVDLAVLLEHEPESLSAHADLVADLQTLVNDREVDVAILNRADPLFPKQVTDRCTLLYGSVRRLRALELYSFKRYQDHRRFLQMERSYVDRMIGALTR